MTTRISDERLTVVDKLAEALRVPTVATADGGDEGLLRRWQALMVELFPRLHETLTWEFPDPWRMIYQWDGASNDRAPILVMAHYDVVPADGAGWSVDPFGGSIRDDSVWGRGALDNKLSHIAILQAVEELVSAGVVPREPIYLAFGGDEETGGARGAARIAQTFAERGIRFGMVLDEGAAVARDMVPSVRGATGLIGCAEKGHINVRLSAQGAAGHASNPPRLDGISVLADALRDIMRRRLPARSTRTTTSFIRALGRATTGVQSRILRNYPLTAPIVHRVLSRVPQTDAMIRTTHVPTMLSGSDAPNVLAATPSASLNIRLLPGQTIDEVLTLLRARVGSKRVSIDLVAEWDNNEAPPESPASGAAFERIANAITATWGEIPVLPYLVTATTDSRHYANVSDATYRFVPMELSAADLAGIHGVDEHVTVENIYRAVQFYRTVITGETM